MNATVHNKGMNQDDEFREDRNNIKKKEEIMAAQLCLVQ